MGALRKFDTWQQKHKWSAIPIAVIKKFSDDQGGSLAALVAYYAFFSLFPLLLVFVTILGFVLSHNHGDLVSIQHSVSANFPGVSKVLTFSSLHGSVVALVIGLATSLWSGLGVTNAAQNALDTVWAVPRKHRPNFLESRARGLGLLVVVGLLFIIATGASGLVSGGLGGPLATVGGIVVSLLVNVILFLVAFRMMIDDDVPTRSLILGGVVAAVFWTILQSFGGAYIGHELKHMSPAYSSVSFVLALIIWLHLGAQLTLYAAELNVVVERKLYPRTLFGPPAEPADQRTLTALAKTEERSDHEQVEVSFKTDGLDGSGGSAPADADTGHRPPDSPRTVTPGAPRRD